jgi:LAO/AO transport system kinase
MSVDAYVKGILEGDRAVLSRAITLVESSLEEDLVLAAEVIDRILPHTGHAVRIGITGVPGVGKSTFIAAMGKVILESEKKLAVLAIDPSSKKSGGSILGDKTRMEELAVDNRAFIRPSPAGSSLGGVSAKTRESMLLCEAAGFEVIIVETVGVGQSETVVKNMVDCFLLLLITGAGDELQGIKKGIMEMADLLVINKADGENKAAVARTKKELEKVIHYFSPSGKDWLPKVLSCSSLYARGLNEVWEEIMEYIANMKVNGFYNENRSNQQLHWMEEHIAYLLQRKFHNNKDVKEALERARIDVREGKGAAISVARNLVGLFFQNK